MFRWGGSEIVVIIFAHEECTVGASFLPHGLTHLIFASKRKGFAVIRRRFQWVTLTVAVLNEW